MTPRRPGRDERGTKEGGGRQSRRHAPMLRKERKKGRKRGREGDPLIEAHPLPPGIEIASRGMARCLVAAGLAVGGIGLGVHHAIQLHKRERGKKKGERVRSAREAGEGEGQQRLASFLLERRILANQPSP